jgi:hypothetical protein
MILPSTWWPGSMPKPALSTINDWLGSPTRLPVLVRIRASAPP